MRFTELGHGGIQVGPFTGKKHTEEVSLWAHLWNMTPQVQHWFLARMNRDCAMVHGECK